MPFAGIPADGFAFLRELAVEQNKPWYEANKARYERGVRAPLGALVEDVAAACARRGVPLEGDAKRSLFRLHRDVRFSKDKSPYKTHAGAVLHRQGGGKQPNGVLYVHVQPRESFAAVAFYMPDPAMLRALRDAIRDDPDGFARIEDGLAARGLALGDGDPLSRMPRGYEEFADSSVADALRKRSFVVRRALTQTELGSSAVVEMLTDLAEAGLPLLRWGWAAIDTKPPEASRIARFIPGARG